MKTYLKSSVGIISLLVVLAAPVLWNCIDYSPEYARFWLLEPNITNQKALLPYTFSAEIFYGYPWSETDTAWQVENVKTWKIMLGENIPEQDIHQILYYTTPAQYFGKKYARKNQLMQSLAKPGHAAHLSYLNFAKNCEEIFGPEAWENESIGQLVPQRINQGQALLKTAGLPQELQRRIAWMLMKLHRYNNEPALALNFYQQYFAENSPKDWLLGAATYQAAEAQPDSVQQNIWIAKAWDAGFYNRIWLSHGLNKKALPAAIKAATDRRDKALLTIIPELQNPGPALKSIQAAYQYDASVPDLSKLMAREVNKLENWLLGPAIFKTENRVEMPYSEGAPKLDSAALLQSDLAHLHACRTFAEQVVAEQKRSDKAFWCLTAAHLAYLDQDFEKSRKWAAQGVRGGDATAAQLVQLHIIDMISEIGLSGKISPETERKIPEIFKAIDNNLTSFEAPVPLRQNLARLLSDIFAQKGERVKSAFLLGQTTENYAGIGFVNASVIYDLLLESGKPTDFDRAIEMVEHPQTEFERWFASMPHRYSADLEWDEKTQKYRLPPGQSAGWDVHKFREFKAMYHTRRNELDSALAAIRNVPDTYWKRHGYVTDYSHEYFQNNPFSVGIPIQQVALTAADNTGRFNKRTLLEKMIALRNTTDPAQQQEAWLLLGNAYYNMTYYGRDWWLMMNPSWSSGEVDAYYSDETGEVSEPLRHWPIGFGVMGFLGVFLLFKRRKGVLWLFFVPLIFAMQCKSASKTNKAEAAIAPFETVYYHCSLAKEYYEKAIKINPGNDLGIAAAYMAGLCQEHQQYYHFTHTRKNWDDKFVPPANPFYEGLKGKNFTSPLSCMGLKEKL